VTGTISDSGKKVRVNGIDATVNANGDWQANNVPVNDDAGRGQFNIAVYPSGSDPNTTPPGETLTTPVILPPVVRATGYTEDYLHVVSSTYNGTLTRTRNRSWERDAGGTSLQRFQWPEYPAECDSSVAWPANWPGGQSVAGFISCNDSYNETSVSAWQNCDLKVTTTSYGFLDDLITRWAGWDTIDRAAETKIELVAGDSDQSGAMQLIRLSASAAAYTNGLDSIGMNNLTVDETAFDGAGTIPLPASSIQILGQSLTPTSTNANVGEMYIAMPAGSKRELPVSVVGGTNYSFDVQAEEVTLRIFSGTNDVSDTTNTVIVGQQINLRCQLSLTNTALTDFQWTVPGYAISNYVADANSGIAYSNFPTTLSNVMFYWVDGASNRILTCSATVRGQKAVGMTTFYVLRPMAKVVTWTGTVALDCTGSA